MVTFKKPVEAMAFISSRDSLDCKRRGLPQTYSRHGNLLHLQIGHSKTIN